LGKKDPDKVKTEGGPARAADRAGATVRPKISASTERSTWPAGPTLPEEQSEKSAKDNTDTDKVPEIQKRNLGDCQQTINGSKPVDL
jgi:hypothetical protein